MFHDGQKLGEFEILCRIGQGGMGAVYKARQTSLDRLVALKTLQSALASDPEYIARFRREAKAAAALNHPNLVQVYSAGESDGLHWFAMEFVEGESAQARLKRKQRLDPAEAIAIGTHVATALDYAWRKAQLIHRDIKPDNIFLSSDGEVKLGDLGLAKSAGETQSLTVTGSSMGTPHYVSPEQGEGKKDVDLRADIYSLGCTLFHLVAGRPPYSGDNAMSVMLQHVTAPVPNPRIAWAGFPAELAKVVTKMIAKKPADRQQTYAEVIADLRRAYDALTSDTVPAKVAVTQPAQVERAAPARVSPDARPGAARAAGAKAAAAASPNPQSAIPNPKSKAPILAGFAAIIAVLALAGWFIFGKKEPQLTEAERAEKAKSSAALQRAEPSATGGRPDGLKPPTTLPAAATKEAWVDALADWRKGKLPEGIVAEGGMFRTTKQFFAPFRTKGPMLDQAARLTSTGEAGKLAPRIYVRYSDYDQGTVTVGYKAHLPWEQKRVILSVRTREGEKESKSWALPAGAQSSTRHTLELRAVGTELTILFNDQLLGSVNDNSLSSGCTALSANASTLIEKFDYLDLGGITPASAGASPVAGGSEVLTFGGHRYQLITQRDIAWDLARSRAQDLGGHLATITTSAEDDAVRKWIKARLAEGGGAWIGALENAPRSYAWVTGEPFAYQGWGLGQPDRTQAPPQSTFAARYYLRSDECKWDDAPIDAKATNGYLVEWDDDGSSKPAAVHTFAGHRYQFVAGAVSWDEAKAKAEAMGGHLATVTSKEENEWIYTTFGLQLDPTLRASSIWLGGAAQASGQSWKWVTGEPFTFTDWNKDEPDYSTTKGQPVKGPFGISIKNHGGLHWFDDPVDRKNSNAGFVVEWDDAGSLLAAPSPSLPVSPSSSPATATKDAPFVNSLGMKFVPVAITGGPTGGQRVLFSVWETRVQDYSVFANETKREWPRPNRPQAGPTHPAVNVSWEDATAFCAWLTDKERKAGTLAGSDAYRLPSDHEWSCAVGIGAREDATKSPAKKDRAIKDVYPWGQQWPPPQGSGNFHGEERAQSPAGMSQPIAGYRDAFVRTAPVGSFVPNSLGLFDIGGNAGEWCEDWFDSAATERLRVYRGEPSGWREHDLLSSKRGVLGPTFKAKLSDGTGFRVVLAPVTTASAAAAPLEPGAVRVWDSPETIPQGVPGISWKDGAVLMEKQNGGIPKSNGRDSIVRCAVRMAPGGWAAIAVRDSGVPSAARVYELYMNRDLRTVELKGRNTGPWQLVKKWPLVRAADAGEWMQVELRTVGEEFTVSIDGKPFEPVRDATLTSPGRVILAGLCSFSDIVYVPLDKTPAASPAQATTETPWVNTVGQEFVPVPGTAVLFCRWETRVSDYGKFADAVKTVDATWTKQEKDGVAVSPRGPEYSHHPVVGVNWDDANAFCAWLTKKELAEGKLPAGMKYRLPTDEEWSRAVGLTKEDGATPHERGEKNMTHFPWGTDFPPKTKAGNYADATWHEKFPNEKWIEGYLDGFATTAPVGSYAPNAHGLHDLGGNVWEWCEDWSDEKKQTRISRGASWATANPNSLHSAGRGHSAPRERRWSNAQGFRIVLAPDAAAPAASAAPARLAPSGEPWVDAFKDAEIAKIGTLGPDGITLLGGTNYHAFASGPKTDGAVRALVNPATSSRLLLSARLSGGGKYQLRITPDAVALARWNQATLTTTELRTFPSPRTEFVEIELRVVGSKLTVKLNGVVAGQVEDATFSTGRFEISTVGAASNIPVHALEYLDLGGSAPAAATPAPLPGTQAPTAAPVPAKPSVPPATLPSPAMPAHPPPVSTATGTATSRLPQPGQGSVLMASKERPFVNSLGMKFVPVPITGGSTDQKRVLFSIWETRVQDYETFIKETAAVVWPAQGFPQGPTHPAGNVSWLDAQAFCKWLTALERKAGRLRATEAYRLPTDHEWSCAVGREKENAKLTPAQKSGKTGKFVWGETWPPPKSAGNFSGEECTNARAPGQNVMKGFRDGFTVTAPVGSFAVNRLGLYDLAGNVWEWCEDDAAAPGAGHRVLRGGSYLISERLEWSFREGREDGNRGPSGGFRVVLAEVSASAAPAGR